MKPRVAAVIGSILACTAAVAQAQQRYPYDVVTSVVLPKGDVQAGPRPAL